MCQTAADNQLDYFSKYQKSLERIRRLKEEIRIAEDIAGELVHENRELKDAMRCTLQVLVESGAI